jgi:hypothetical protein
MSCTVGWSRIAAVSQCSDARGEYFDCIDDGVEAPRAEQIEPVLRAGQLCVDDRAARRGAKVIDEASRVLDEDERVLVAVRDKARRRARRRVIGQ